MYAPIIALTMRHLRSCILQRFWHYGLIINCVLSSCLGGLGLTVTVKDGYIFPQGNYVGVYTSQLQKHVIDALYPPIQPNEILKNIHIVNDTVLRYLDLQGAYLADAPLVLPSLFVLKLNGSIVDAKNITNSIFNGVSHVGFGDTKQYTILGRN